MKNIKTQLQGTRVLIRRLKLSDADDLYVNVRTKDVAKWTLALPHPYPEDGAVKFIRKQQRLWRVKKAFTFAIVSKETGKLIGTVSLKRVDLKHGCAELGYLVGKKYWNQGLATEAAKLVLRFGFDELKLHRIYALAFEANIASNRVLEKSGFKLEGKMREAVLRYKKRQHFLNYGILKSEFIRH